MRRFARGLMLVVASADKSWVTRIRSPYVGLLASALGFLLGGACYLRGSR